MGYRKLSSYLKINKKRIQRILKKFRGPKAVKPKPKDERKFPNLLICITKELINHPEKLARGNWLLKDGKNGYRKLIEPVRPYQLWAADWKEFKVVFLGLTIYIFAIIDVYTRQLKGFSFSLVKDVNTALKAAQMAVNNSRKDLLFLPRNLIVHSDQGGAYLAEEHIAFWKNLGVSISMTDKGKPTQNPYIEGFFSILKRFWLSQQEFLTAIEVEKSLTRFFGLYNREWKHSGIGYQTPDERLESCRTTKNHIFKS